MAHDDALEGKWRGNWRMEWVASTLTLPRNMVYPALLPPMRTPRLPAVNWTDAPRRFKWTHPFRRKTKSGFWACAITFQTRYTYTLSHNLLLINSMPHYLKKKVLVQVRYLIQFLRKSDFEEMVVNSIHQVCHMKMAVHYAVMVRCKLKRNYGFTGSRVRLKPDGTWWRTGRGSEGETGKRSG